MPTHSCPTLCDPMNCRLPGSSVHEIFQARILEWVAISYPGHLLNPGIKLRSPAIRLPGGCLKAPCLGCNPYKLNL